MQFKTVEELRYALSQILGLDMTLESNPDGQIVVYTGLYETYDDDGEIALTEEAPDDEEGDDEDDETSYTDSETGTTFTYLKGGEHA